MLTPGLDLVLLLYLEWSEVNRKGAVKTGNTFRSLPRHLFQIPVFITFTFVSGGLFNCHISICDAGGATGPWPHVTWGQRRSCVLPLSRLDPSH